MSEGATMDDGQLWVKYQDDEAMALVRARPATRAELVAAVTQLEEAEYGYGTKKGMLANDEGVMNCWEPGRRYLVVEMEEL